MIDTWNSLPKPDSEEIRQRLETAHSRLFAQQMQMKENRLPVLVLFEGWGAAGKGTILGKVIRNLDPRFFTAVSMHDPTEDEKRRPFLCRYFTQIPEAGQFEFLDSGWMSEIIKDRLFGRLSAREYKNRIGSVRRFERSLTDNGYLVLKFFFHIPKKEQKKRLNLLLSSPHTAWQVDDYDLWENKHYSKCRDAFDTFLEDTSSSSSPWYVLDARSRKWAELQVMETLVTAIDIALKNHALTVPLIQNIFPLQKMPKLAEIDLDKTIEPEAYREELKRLQTRLRALHNQAYLRDIPIVIAYEGWDAAGKGGNIKRVAAALDPRGYEAIPIAAPTPEELAHHYLWRFWNNMPKAGHIAIFDRTWYGRVMVERIEGFCTEAEWKRAYQEINEMESHMANFGAVVLKFWLHIDKDEQERRFKERMENPAKQWKITDEDWRNREKWDQYEQAVDEMLVRTSTTYAPWIVVEGNSKYYARVKVLRTVVEALEKKIKEVKKKG